MEMGGNTETAVLAGGCAWIMQQLLRHPEGVISTRTGFMGGENDHPTEADDGGHAEVVEVVFDPSPLLSGAARGVLPGAPTRPRRGHGRFAVPLGDLLHQRGAAGGGRGDDQRC